METHKKLKTAFAGHSHFSLNTDEAKKRLIKAIREEIDNGCLSFTMGTYGDFDTLSLNVCRELRKEYSDIEIEVVITSLHKIKKFVEKDGTGTFTPYEDVKTIMYYIEDEYFMNRIISSNQQMINNCDTLICYINPKRYKSGAKKTLNYAKKKGLKIVNLFKPEDEPFYLMSIEEKEKALKDYIKNKNSNVDFKL